MIRSVASLVRRVAGSPDRLARGLTVLAVLAAAATAILAGPARAGALAAGPACPAASQAVSGISGAAASAAKAHRAIIDRTRVCAGDIEAIPDLGLPDAPTDAARPPPASATSYRHAPDAAPAAAPDGSPHRPPRAA